MLRDIDWSEDRAYSTDSDEEPIQFYLDCLFQSKSFDLLLGYFSSAAISVLALGFAKFLHAGGKVRMIANNVLSEEDKQAIASAQNGTFSNTALDISDLKKLKRSLDEYGEHFFQCLAWLIAHKKIELKIIRPKKGKGIAHYKSGTFSDGENLVGFKASCNFTAYGLLENLEELEAFLSWENGRSNKLIKRQTDKFNKIFSGSADFVEYLDVTEVEVAIKNEFGDKSLNELIIQEKDLLEKKRRVLDNKKIRKTFEKNIIRIEEIIREPKFPYPDGAREYQVQAYENWVSNDYKGIFAMATGTGKTITSLNCLLNLYKLSDSYKAVIIVPTTALLEQWKKECLKFNFKNIVTVSSKENWNGDLAFFNTANKLNPTSFIVIVTYASFTRPKFQSHFQQLPAETLLIADEVHNMGAQSMLKILPNIHLKRRIGLSATPNRQFDIDGNTALEDFFSDKYPYVFSYSMKEALEIGWLCQYSYYPHIVRLTDNELSAYIKISKSLLAYLDPKTGRYKECKEVEELLLRRKRIIHKATNKKDAFKEILKSEFKKRGNLKYTLVYVPEGVDTNYVNNDEAKEDDEDVQLINEYTKIVKDTDYSIMVKQFTSKTPKRDEVIHEFEEGKLHVLTSMKCLDEGVDVPRSELAIFCSSTGNPRQFIQRRGRVLRKHDDKIHAVIHDLVVVPKIDAEENNFEMERNLLKKELERVVDFSELSMNAMDSYEELKEVLDYYNLTLYEFAKQ